MLLTTLGEPGSARHHTRCVVSPALIRQFLKASERATAISPGAESDRGAEVVDLVARRAELPADSRPMPCLDKYDALLDKESS